MEHMNPFISEHHPDLEFIQTCCKNYYCSNLSVLHLVTRQNHTSPPHCHSHEDYEFLIPLTPFPVLIHGDSLHFGEVGYCYPFESGQSHGSKFCLSDASYDNIVIKKTFFEKIAQEKGLEQLHFGERFSVSEELKSYIAFFKEESSKGVYRDSRKLDALAFLIASILLEDSTNPNANYNQQPSAYQKGIYQVVSYIHANYHKDLMLDDLASMCNLSKNYFITAFKKYIGTSPYFYINRLRISKAKVLLDSSNFSIQEIAKKCGYQRSNSFTTTFKSFTGLTPSQYRRKEK